MLRSDTVRTMVQPIIRQDRRIGTTGLVSWLDPEWVGADQEGIGPDLGIVGAGPNQRRSDPT